MQSPFPRDSRWDEPPLSCDETRAARGGVLLQRRLHAQRRDHKAVEIAGLYWHFVDIVWIVIFTVVDLVPYK